MTKKYFSGRNLKNDVIIISIVLIISSILTTLFIRSLSAEGGENEIILNLSFPEPEITEVNISNISYHMVSMNGSQTTDNPGLPRLPVKPLRVLLPQKGVIESINVTYNGNTSLGAGYNILIGQPQNESMFNSSTPYPTELFKNLGTIGFRGYSILTFDLNPVYYINDTGEIYYFKNMTVTITTNESGTVSPLFRNLDKDNLRMQQIVDDYSKYSTYIETPDHTFSSMVDPLWSYDYVIITKNDFINADPYPLDAREWKTFQDFSDYKNANGVSTRIVTVELIKNNPYYWGSSSSSLDNANDTQSQIRNFICEAYNGWETEFVLLGGDNETIPARYIWQYEIVDGNQQVPSDHYYACLDGTYNGNNDVDGKWGEKQDGENGNDVDLVSDICIGRVPVSTSRQVSNFVIKTLAYEDTPNHDPYLAKVLLVGINLDWGERWIHFPDMLKNETVDIWDTNGYSTYGIPSNLYTAIDKLYDSDYYQGPDNDGYDIYKFPPRELIKRLNDNINFVNQVGHGDYNGLYWFKEIGKLRPVFLNNDADRLTNDKYFFMYAQACLVGGFDHNCLATHLLTGRHGAFAVNMNTREAFANIDDPQPPQGTVSTSTTSQRFDRFFWDTVFGFRISNTLPELSWASQKSKEKIIGIIHNTENDQRDEYRWNFFARNFFGDPQLSLKKPVENQPPDISETPQGSCIIGKLWEYTTSTTDPENDPVYYNWKWDNQENINWYGPYNSGEATTKLHLWDDYGTHTVNVRAKDQFGAISDWSDPCTSQVSFDLSMQINPNPLVVGQQANFYGQAECGGQYEWDFGQGRGKQYQQNANQTYDTPGEYIVNLTVTNEQNISCTISTMVKVVLLKSDFVCSSIYSAPHERISFNDTSDGYYTIGNWSWDFGDGHKSYTRNTSYEFTTEGVYVVSLTVRDAYSNENKSIKTIYIDTTPPEISMVSTNPQIVGYGSNVSIIANIIDNVSGIKTAQVNITDPDNVTGYFSMNYSSNNTYEYAFNGTWSLGDYEYTIWAVDDANNSNSSAGHSFSVSCYFGYNLIGSMNQSILDTITGSVFTVHEKGVADNITVYIDPGNATTDSHYQCLIYRHNDSTLVGTTEEKNVSSGKGWRTFSFSSPKPILCNGTEYVINCWGDNQRIKMYYDNGFGTEQGHYFEGVYNYTPDPISFTHEDRRYSIYCDYTEDYSPPILSNISATPHTVGFGFNVTISANVTDAVSGVNHVNVNITNPDHTHGNYTMINTTGNTFQYIYNNTWQTGQYNYTIWALDNSNNSNTSTTYHFHVSTTATISIATLKDSYSGSQYINITDPPNPQENLTVISRGLTWNTYYNASSGNNILETYIGPVNYQQDNLTWTPINNTISQLISNHPAYVYGYRTGNDHGLYGVYFKSNAQNDWPVAFTYNRSDDPTVHVIRSKLVGVGYVDPQSNWAYQYLQNVQSSQGQTNDNSITFEDVFTGTDITWSYGNIGLKEEITMSNATKTVLQNHPPSQYGLEDTSSYLVFITKLDYQNLNLYNGSGLLAGNVTISDAGVDFKDILGQFKCALPLGDAYELNNESMRQKLTYRIVHLNGNTYLLSGLKISKLNTMTFPVVIDPTLTVYSTSNDGYIYKSGSTYSTVQGASTGTINSTGTYITIGQWKTGFPATYNIYRGFVFFNTSALPTNAYLDNATLSLYKKDDYSTTDFDITIQNGQPTYPHNPMQTGDYAKSHYSGNGGTLNTASFTSGYNAIRLGNLNLINKTGITKLCLCSSRDISGTAPTGSEYINVYSYEYAGIGCQPKLVITYRNQSKIKNTGSTDIKGYLLIQVQFYNSSQAKWVLDNDTVNESTPRIITASGSGSGSQLGLDTIFNGHIRASNLIHGIGTYRVYTAYRDPEGNILRTNDGVELKAWWQFNKT